MVVLLAATLAVVVSPFMRSVLPERFLRDEVVYVGLVNGWFSTTNESFANTAAVLRLLGADWSLSFVSLVTVTLFVSTVLVAAPPKVIELQPWPVVVLCLFALLVGTVFLSLLAKDVLVMGVVLLFLLAIRSGRRQIVWLVAAISLALFIREYWFITIALYVAFFNTLRSSRAMVRVPALVVGSLVALSLAFAVVLEVPLDFHRESVLDALRIQPETAIQTPFGDGSAESMLNTLYAFLVLWFPLPLALEFTAYHLASAAFIGFVWVSWLRSLASAAGSGLLKSRSDITRAFSLMLAFSVVGALFEPDYGSYLRHLTPFLPVILYAVVRTNISLQQENGSEGRTAPRSHRVGPLEPA